MYPNARNWIQNGTNEDKSFSKLETEEQITIANTNNNIQLKNTSKIDKKLEDNKRFTKHLQRKS